MKKRIFCTLMAVLMLFSTLSISVFADGETNIQINDETALVAFAASVNNGTYDCKDVELGYDINALPESWEGIGNADHPFSGKFDGNGHCVTEAVSKALFGNIDVANAQIEGFYIGTKPAASECTHNRRDFAPATNKTHYVVCTECKMVTLIQACTFGDGSDCYWCGNKKPTQNPENPEKPEVPENPEKPEVPSVPSTPITPAIPNKPTTPETPNKPNVDKSTLKFNFDIACLRRQVFTIKAEKNEGGKVSNFGKTGKSTVKWGCSKTYTITPNDGYVVADVLVDGVSVGAVEKYTFKKVTENHKIKVVFEIAE